MTEDQRQRALRRVAIENEVRNCWRNLVESLGEDDQDSAEDCVGWTADYIEKLLAPRERKE